jgi:hypothetical protein
MHSCFILNTVSLLINVHIVCALQMPKSSKRKRQMQAARASKKQKREEAQPTLEKTLTSRVRNISLDSDDDEEAVYTEMLLDEFGKAMEDVFDIFHKDMRGDGGEDHRPVISKAVSESQSKKPSNRLDESPSTKKRRFSLPNHYNTIVTELLLILPHIYA